MELWHVLNRGVERRTIFHDDHDRFRFVHGLMMFNTARPSNNTTYLLESTINDFVSRYGAEARVVDIHGWCIMPNHYHLLLSERAEGGITRFLRKLNIGYSKYFNDRYTRSGGLFQGRTKKVLIDSDAHFLHILNYIHFNPLDLTENHEWRSGALIDEKMARQQLNDYRWSSYQDYSGRSNFPHLLNKDLFEGVFGNVGEQTLARLGEMALDSTLALE